MSVATVAEKAREIFWVERGDLHPFPWMVMVNGVLSSVFIPNRVRVQLYRLFGLRIHRKTIVRPGAIFRSNRVQIGPSCLVGYRVLFDVRSDITIGRNVGIGADVVFVDTDHDMSDPKLRNGVDMTLSPIVVGDGARISTGSMILPGVTIGEGAVVGAGSLVIRDCEPHALYVGRPATKVRDLPR